MKAEKIKQEVARKLAKEKCGAGLVLAGFSSIYACRNDLRPLKKIKTTN